MRAIEGTGRAFANLNRFYAARRKADARAMARRAAKAVRRPPEAAWAEPSKEINPRPAVGRRRLRPPQPSPVEVRIEAALIRLVDIAAARLRMLAEAPAG